MRIYIKHSRNNKKNISITNILILAISLIGYVLLRVTDNPAINFTHYLIIILPVYILYFYLILRILKSKIHSIWNVLIVITFSFLFRIVLFDQEPWFSDDVYRYLWDGKIGAAGINPYQYPPNHEELEDFRDSRIFSNLNYPEIATVYPPVSQFFFLINEYLGGSLISWKIILLILELVLTIILMKMAKLFKLDRMRVMIFTLNPLLIIETYMNGHLEVMGLLFLWLAFYSFYVRRTWLASGFIALATMVKFFPALISIPFIRPHFWKKLLFIIAIGIFITVPFTCSGVIPMSGFFSYVNRWSFNGAIFKIITSVFYALPLNVIDLGFFNLNQHLERVFLNQEFYYKILAAFSLLIVILDQMRKSKMTSLKAGIRPLSASFIIATAFLLLTPTLHPWYIIWIIPFLIFMPKWSWLLFTFLIQISYQVLHDYRVMGIWQEQTWILFIEYVPFYAILIWEYVDRRKICGWFLQCA